MSKRAVCLLGVVLVALGVSAGGTHMIDITKTVRAHFADGGGPTPPPIPMKSLTPTPTYVADGGGPTPPPIPMKASGKSEPTYVADGGGPTPPPIPMGHRIASC